MKANTDVFHYMKEKGLVSSSVTSKESVSDLPANHACLCFLPSTWILDLYEKITTEECGFNCFLKYFLFKNILK
jgi:hypothetical protein